MGKLYDTIKKLVEDEMSSATTRRNHLKNVVSWNGKPLLPWRMAS